MGWCRRIKRDSEVELLQKPSCCFARRVRFSECARVGMGIGRLSEFARHAPRPVQSFAAKRFAVSSLGVDGISAISYQSSKVVQSGEPTQFVVFGFSSSNSSTCQFERLWVPRSDSNSLTWCSIGKARLLPRARDPESTSARCRKAERKAPVLAPSAAEARPIDDHLQAAGGGSYRSSSMAYR